MADSADNIFGKKLIDDENHISSVTYRAILSEFTEKKKSFDFPFQSAIPKKPISVSSGKNLLLVPCNSSGMYH